MFRVYSVFLRIVYYSKFRYAKTKEDVRACYHDLRLADPAPLSQSIACSSKWIAVKYEQGGLDRGFGSLRTC